MALNKMELNSDHPLITRLYKRSEADPEDPLLGDALEILFEVARLTEGSEVADPVRLNRLTLVLLQRTL